MPRRAFISYRRSDTTQAVQGLWAQLRARFGQNNVFMDVSGIDPGTRWPDRLRAALKDASIVLAVIGPNWLTAADEYGRRRLDMDDDWVRNELLHAIQGGKPILPVRVAGAAMPPKAGVPPDLLPLLDDQGLELHDDSWDQDVNRLGNLLAGKFGLTDYQKPVAGPDRRKRVTALTTEQIDEALATLPEWEPVESMVPGEYPKVRQELRRAYRFPSFRKAIAFMAEAADGPIHATVHHPRWENQWRTVTVYLSTWDIDNRISHFDVDLARALEVVYEQGHWRAK